MKLAKYIVDHKIEAQYNLVRKYSKSIHSFMVESVKTQLKALRKTLQSCKTIEEVRGHEGIASRYYFSIWASLLRDDWKWQGRIKHPALDPVNALLSYSYTFLEREVRMALIDVGLDVRIGVLHSNNGRKDSLVYDLMDLLRQKNCDRFVLKVFTLKRMVASDFDVSERGCFLNKVGRNKWIQLFEAYLMEPVQEYQGKAPREYIHMQIKSFYHLLFEHQSAA